MILNNYWAWKYAIETNIYYTYNQQAKDSTRQTTIKGTDGQTYRMASNIAQGDYIIPNIDYLVKNRNKIITNKNLKDKYNNKNGVFASPKYRYTIQYK